MNLVRARTLAVIAEVGARGIAAQKGYRDTAGLLRDVQNVRMSTAKARCRAADDVVARRSFSGNAGGLITEISTGRWCRTRPGRRTAPSRSARR